MDLPTPEAILSRASKRLVARTRTLYACAACILILAVYPVLALDGLGRVAVLMASASLAAAFAVFGAVGQSEARAALCELRAYLEFPAQCWHWNVDSAQWAEWVSETNLRCATEALMWPIRGTLSGVAVYALALLMTGEGGREGLIRFGALGFCISLLFSVGELLGLNRSRTRDIPVFVTPGGIYADDVYHSFAAQGEAADSVDLRETSGGLELVATLVSTRWPPFSRREVAVPVPDEISGEAVVALGSLAELWGLVDRVSGG